MFSIKNVNQLKKYENIYILNTARGGDELLAGPFELEVGCKNKSACEVPTESTS